ncbi:MAG: hypothetical protein KAR31_09675, partial [Candidatus Omnitrophica bacterium]|nr:hypothetical protein [Candidatus Omnitrophota bacterium]
MHLSNVHNWINRLKPLHAILVLAALGLLAYANAVNHPFVHDDVVFIQQNPNLADFNLKNVFLQTA